MPLPSAASPNVSIDDSSFLQGTFTRSFLGPPGRIKWRAHAIGMPRNIERTRFYVWRSNDWHPVGGPQERQIRDKLYQDQRRFEVTEGSHKWTVDTNSPNGWVLINRSGRKRAMKWQETLESAHNVDHMDASSRSPSRPSRMPILFWGSGANIIDALRNEWDVMVRSGTNQTFLAREDVLQAWQNASPQAKEEDLDLIVQSAADFFLKADLDRSGTIEQAEWLHYRLLENQAPSFHALSQINEMLLAWLQRDSTVLRRLLQEFENSGGQSGRITPKKLKEVASRWLATTQKSIWFPGYSTALEHLQQLVEKGEALLEHEDGDLTYYDFLNQMLGRRHASVQLYQYDLSGGRAWWLSPILLCGKQLEGVWHTGVVVHGREYWFGGNVFESEPGKTPFGKPDKIVDMSSTTMRTREDLWNFVCRELSPEFTTETYDVLELNCNHFSDAICLFLMNEHIPEDVLRQPQEVMGTCAFKLLRPLLNWALGRFKGNESAGAEERSMGWSTLQHVWAEIEEGSLVVYEYEEGWTCLGRVVEKVKETCSLKWFDLRARQIRLEADVPLSSVRLLPRVGRDQRSKRRLVAAAGGSPFGTCYHAAETEDQL